MGAAGSAAPEEEEIAMAAEEYLETDHLLLARLGALGGESDWDASWRRFFDRYEPIIFSVALREGLSEAQAEEVLQETMVHLVRVFREGRYQRERGLFRNFLLGTVRWKIGDARRRWMRVYSRVESFDVEPSTDVLPLHERIPDPNAAPDAAIERSFRLGIVERALEALVTYEWVGQQRVEIFAALVSGERTPAEVAEAYGMKLNAVHQVRHQVQRKLRRMIACLEEGADPNSYQSADDES